MIPDELFDLVSYRIHPEAHITLNQDVCKGKSFTLTYTGSAHS